MAETAWGQTSHWLTGWDVIFEHDWRKLTRSNREAVIVRLEELLEKARRELNA